MTRIGGALSGPIPLALRVFGRRSCALRYAAAACSITGSLVTRFAWLEAGKTSARPAHPARSVGVETTGGTIRGTAGESPAPGSVRVAHGDPSHQARTVRLREVRWVRTGAGPEAGTSMRIVSPGLACNTVSR